MAKATKPTAVSSAGKERVSIFPCNCSHDFQDKTYGKGRRVWNWARGVSSTGGWRCTVCEKTRVA